MISKYSDFYDYMLLELPDCPKSVVLQHLKQAFRTFTHDTELWTQEVNDIDIVADQTTYTPTLSWDASIKRIVWLKLGGAVEPETHYEVHQSIKVKFNTDYVPTYALTDGMDIKVALVPDPNSNEIDEDFFTHWFEAIMWKAFSTLMVMPGKRWTDSGKAQMYMAQYLARFNEAVRERYTGHKGGTLHITPRGAFM